MFRTILLSSAILALAPAVQASEQTPFQAAISVNTQAIADQSSATTELANIERQARDACRYESESVLATQVDQSCVSDLMSQVVSSVENAELSTAFSRSAHFTPATVNGSVLASAS